MADDDKLLVVPLGAESKAITQTISNETAMQILEVLADGPISTSAIAKKLDIPLTTVQYNIEKLIDAGLAKVEKTKYSEKGREVKLYSPAKRFIVLVPEKSSGQAVIDALKKYLVLLPIAAIVAALVEIAVPLKSLLPRDNVEAFGALPSATNDTRAGDVLFTNMSIPNTPPIPKSSDGSLLDSVVQGASSFDPLGHTGLWFFLGCLLVIGLIVTIEVMRYKNIRILKHKK